MSEKWIVALDQGTSGCRACAIDEHGIVRATQHKIFSPDRPQKGLSSYDGEELLSAQKEVLNTLLDQIGPQKVAALAVCSQRSTVVLWNKRTGKPLAPVLTWEDGRSLEQSNAADISQEQVHQQTGLFKTPFFSAPKITWCLEHCPAVASAAQAGELLAAPVASYFIWHLTGADVFATDPTLAQRTLLWDIAQGTWSETLCNAFKISPSWLPQLQPTVSNYGTYLYKGVSIPICVCVADQQAAAFCETGAQTLANYGTGAFVLHPAGDKLSILPGMLSSISASGNGDKPQFLLEGPIFAAGSILQWLKEVKKINFEYDQLDLLAHASTSPVQLLPALGGLGAPYWDYHVQAVVENVTSQTQVADWVAGSLRAIAARVADIIYYLKFNDCEVSSLRMSGGVSNSTYLLEQQANILGMDICYCAQTEGSALGCALLAASYLGWNVNGWKHAVTEIISPRVSYQQSLACYEQWQTFVRRCRRK